MPIFEFVPFLIIPIILLAAVVAAVYVISARRQRGIGGDPGIGTVRRLYFYAVAFVALMMAANGVVQIVRYILESLFGGQVVHASQTQLAVGLALTIVGLPLWLAHWVIVQRHVRSLPVERGSVLRKLYVYVVLGVALGLVMFSSVKILQWIFGTGDFSGYHLGALAVWSGVWAFYWRIEGAEGQPSVETLGIRRFYIYGASLVALSMLAAGLGQAVGVLLREGYDSLASQPVLLPSESGLWRPFVRTVISLAIVGGGAWAAHWLYFARNDFGSVLRQIYLYIFAILGGMVTAVVSVAVLLFGALTWLIGAPLLEDSTAGHFRFVPGTLAALSIGIGLWAYHWWVVQKEARSSPVESRGAQRVYTYVLAGLGLGALATGIGVVVDTALAIVAEVPGRTLVGEDLWREPIALSVTLGILGVPLWGYYWRSIQRQVSSDGAEERASLVRRIFIFVVLGAGMLALLGSLSTLLFFLFKDLLGGGVSRGTLRDIRPVLDIIAAAVFFLPYYWMVYRRDRMAEPETPSLRLRRKDVTVLVSEGGDDFVRNLEAALGYRVNTLQWADPGAAAPELAEEQHQELARHIGDVTAPSVLLIPDGAGVRVLSYR